MADNAVQPGRVLAGRYRLQDKLGEGGFGTIWRAEHLVLCAPVAVKVIDREVGADEEALGRFMREAQAAAALRSPHVVQILDYGVDEGVPFIAMELLEGETLAQRLNRVTRLSPLETTRVVSHVARAIGRAHDAGIIHRDLKPENVFIVHNEDAEIVKVLDFGVAKVDSAKLGGQGTRTRTGSLLGTPYYMSPEQAQGNKTVDHRTDLWAVGVIAFECLTSKRPFESEGLGDLVLQICVRPLPVPSELAPVPEGFDAWFAKACARDPEERFQSARAMVDALREVVGGEARETLATLPEGETDGSAPVRITVASASMPKPAPTVPGIGAADTVVAPSARRPAATLGQFGTTHAASPKPPKRTALVVMVGGLAMVIGMGAGFAVLASRDRGSAEPGAETSAKDPEADPAEPAASPEPTSTSENDPSPAPGTPAARDVRDQADAGASAAAAEDAAARKEASPAAQDAGKAEAPKKDAAPRDWGVDWGDASATAPPPKSAEPALPPPPAPIDRDQ